MTSIAVVVIRTSCQGPQEHQSQSVGITGREAEVWGSTLAHDKAGILLLRSGKVQSSLATAHH